MRLPTDGEIRDRAEQDGLLRPDADLDPTVRARVARLLQDEQTAADEAARAAAAAPDRVLLSRTTTETPAGRLTVEVTLIPKETP